MICDSLEASLGKDFNRKFAAKTIDALAEAIVTYVQDNAEVSIVLTDGVTTGTGGVS